MTVALQARMSEGPYTREFFETVLEESYQSAQRIVPLILALVPAHSVLDVGCGTGQFLRAFAEAGVDDFIGIDGTYVPLDKLVINPKYFNAHDLAAGFNLRRRFDLVVTLEVAEHLPLSAAESFVDALVRHADVVLFSAAIPFQGGTGHLNEQWPSNWAERFARRGYRAYDAIRPAIWGDKQVAWWYCQNTIVFANEVARARYPGFAAMKPTEGVTLDHVHPANYARSINAMLNAVEENNRLHKSVNTGREQVIIPSCQQNVSLLWKALPSRIETSIEPLTITGHLSETSCALPVIGTTWRPAATIS
jgi:2-polyprenyl-3-methyl-5-hydroxy-6-metoxy-1,4-benzoquinol methylase